MYSTNCTHLNRGYCTIGSRPVPEHSRGCGDRWAEKNILHLVTFCWWCGRIGNVIPTSQHKFLPLCNTCLGDSHIFTVRNEVAKVMFLQASVCPQGEGVSVSVHAGIPHPLGADIPPPEQTTPGNRHPPLGSRHPPGADTPPGETATAADGTHPTGMHSCKILKYF